MIVEFSFLSFLFIISVVSSRQKFNFREKDAHVSFQKSFTKDFSFLKFEKDGLYSK